MGTTHDRVRRGEGDQEEGEHLTRRLEGGIGFVTGGARGQGVDGADLLASAGALVYIADVLDSEGEEPVSRRSVTGRSARYLSLDVTDDVSWSRAVATVESECDRLDFLVNNAGIAAANGVPDTALEAWERVHAVNVTGQFLDMRAAVALMTRTGGGARWSTSAGWRR